MTDRDNDQLQDLLAQALRSADPVPEHVTRAAREAYTWRTIDAELAELVFDSAKQEPIGVRSGEASRQVTFRAPGVEIEMMVMAEGTRRLVGQLVPPQQAVVELRRGESVRETATDGLGRFSFVDVPTGPIQVAVVASDVSRVVTEWMVV